MCCKIIVILMVAYMVLVGILVILFLSRLKNMDELIDMRFPLYPKHSTYFKIDGIGEFYVSEVHVSNHHEVYVLECIERIININKE